MRSFFTTIATVGFQKISSIWTRFSMSRTQHCEAMFRGRLKIILLGEKRKVLSSSSVNENIEDLSFHLGSSV